MTTRQPTQPVEGNEPVQPRKGKHKLDAAARKRFEPKKGNIVGEAALKFVNSLPKGKPQKVLETRDIEHPKFGEYEVLKGPVHKQPPVAGIKYLATFRVKGYFYYPPTDVYVEESEDCLVTVMGPGSVNVARFNADVIERAQRKISEGKGSDFWMAVLDIVHRAANNPE